MNTRAYMCTPYKLQVIDRNQQMIPVFASGVGIFYNNKNINDLVLSRSVLDDIMTGKITSWSHPDIMQENPKGMSRVPCLKLMGICNPVNQADHGQKYNRDNREDLDSELNVHNRLCMLVFCDCISLRAFASARLDTSDTREWLSRWPFFYDSQSIHGLTRHSSVLWGATSRAQQGLWQKRCTASPAIKTVHLSMRTTF